MASVSLLGFGDGSIEVPDELEQLAITLAFHQVIRSSEDVGLADGWVEVSLHDQYDLYEVLFSVHGEETESGPFSNEALWDDEWAIDGRVIGLLADSDEPEIDWSATLRFPLDWAALLTRALANTDLPFFTALLRDEDPESSDDGPSQTGYEGHWSTAARAMAMLAAGRDGTGEHGRFDRGIVYQLVAEPLQIVEIDRFDDRRNTLSRPESN